MNTNSITTFLSPSLAHTADVCKREGNPIFSPTQTITIYFLTPLFTHLCWTCTAKKRHTDQLFLTCSFVDLSFCRQTCADGCTTPNTYIQTTRSASHFLLINIQHTDPSSSRDMRCLVNAGCLWHWCPCRISGMCLNASKAAYHLLCHKENLILISIWKNRDRTN